MSWASMGRFLFLFFLGDDHCFWQWASKKKSQATKIGGDGLWKSSGRVKVIWAERREVRLVMRLFSARKSLVKSCENTFGSTGLTRSTRDWQKLVRRCRAVPCLAWVTPFWTWFSCSSNTFWGNCWPKEAVWDWSRDGIGDYSICWEVTGDWSKTSSLQLTDVIYDNWQLATEAKYPHFNWLMLYMTRFQYSEKYHSGRVLKNLMLHGMSKIDIQPEFWNSQMLSFPKM